MYREPAIAIFIEPIFDVENGIEVVSELLGHTEALIFACDN